MTNLIHLGISKFKDNIIVVTYFQLIFRYALVGLLAVFFFSSFATAQQRVNYQSLLNRSDQRQNIFIDHFSLPGDNENTLNFVTTFRINYNFLPFRKVSNPDNQFEFFSSTGMRIELFRANERIRSNRDRVPIEGLESAARASWQDTAFAETYEQTQSKNTFVTGSMQTEVEPGLYNFFMQLNRGNEQREESSQARQVNLVPYGEKTNGTVILVEELQNSGDQTVLQLLNFGDDAFYGQDFYAFIQLPNYNRDNNYTVTFNRVNISEEDTTRGEQVFQEAISQNQIYENIKPRLGNDLNNPTLLLNRQNRGGYTYALVEIPNSRFPNATYQLRVNNGNQRIAQSIIRSLWLEMPTSLLNIDVAINMLKFIAGKETINRINRGSESERERKFREFWEQKDPTPETEYNELMAEYYNRIDYAYEHFSTVNTPGFENDRGEIYIQYGPPNNTERRFPSGESAVEIWTYDNNKFVFRATSGFGDFELVNR